MSTVLKNDIHTNIAQIIYNGILSRTSKAYFFLGRTIPWEGEGDFESPTPLASRAYENETRDQIVAIQNATISDVSFAIKREDWSSGTVYDMYDDRYSSEFVAPSGATDIADANMFVLTDDFNIYKCISNNYNSPSTVKPTGKQTSGYIGPLADGYVWKYMSTLETIQRTKFLTTEYLPVNNSVSGFYQSGIDLNPIIVSGGVGYTQNNTVLTVIGDGFGAELTAIVDEDTGQIVNVVVDNPGSGYSTASCLITTPDPGQGRGEGAEISIAVDRGELLTSYVSASAVDGEISFIYVNNPGIGYVDSSTSVIIEGNGINASAEPVIVGGSIVAINIINRGSGYTKATVTVLSETGQDFAADVIISPVGGHGKNIVKEAYASILAFQMTTIDELNQGFIMTNDYRQSGLLFDVDKFQITGQTRQKFTSDYGSACYRLDLPFSDITSGVSLSDFALDQELTNIETGKKIYVVEKQDLKDSGVTVGVSLLLQIFGDTSIEIGDSFRNSNDKILFKVSVDSTITLPQIDKYSGSMVFINNRTPFRKNVDQIVNLRTFIEF
jgi:hypothetical protein